jgi:hypothetical protein
VFTSSAINAAKASAQTAAAQPPTSYGPNQTPATTTTATAQSTYPSAQPASPAVPAPTSAATQRYVPLQPTPTTKIDSDIPPPPQPGAFPTPLNKTTVVPPPKVGETYHQPSVAPSYPPQMSIPPPTSAYRAQPPSSTTSTTTIPLTSYPVPISASDAGSTRRSIEHPPGYHQNAYASEPSSDQRRAQEAHNASAPQDTGEGGIGGLGADNIWNSAKKWATQAGEKLSEAEAEVWKKINKQ